MKKQDNYIQYFQSGDEVFDYVRMYSGVVIITVLMILGFR